MGYMAKGSGEIQFKDIVDMSAVAQAFKDAGFDVYEETGSTIAVDFYDKYHEDEIYSLLDSISSYGEVVDGCFEFVGEDDAFWQIRYNSVTKKWDESNGTVTYSTTIDKDFVCKNCGQSLKSIAGAIKSGARYCFNCGYRIDVSTPDKTVTAKKKYVVVITETLQKRVTVEAEDTAEAEERAEANWNNAGYENGDPEYILTSDNFVEANFQAIEEIDDENRKPI